MKRLLFICICFLFCISSWAKSISIALYYDYADERANDRRSVSVLPTASYDGNAICIYSYIGIENLQVVVKDEEGNVVYSNVALVPAGQTYSFAIDATAGEEYVLELTYGDKFLYGSFEL